MGFGQVDQNSVRSLARAGSEGRKPFLQASFATFFSAAIPPHPPKAHLHRWARKHPSLCELHCLSWPPGSWVCKSGSSSLFSEGISHLLQPVPRAKGRMCQQPFRTLMPLHSLFADPPPFVFLQTLLPRKPLCPLPGFQASWEPEKIAKFLMVFSWHGALKSGLVRVPSFD